MGRCPRYWGPNDNSPAMPVIYAVVYHPLDHHHYRRCMYCHRMYVPSQKSVPAICNKGLLVKKFSDKIHFFKQVHTHLRFHERAY